VPSANHWWQRELQTTRAADAAPRARSIDAAAPVREAVHTLTLELE
jgi:hypothetical protein